MNAFLGIMSMFGFGIGVIWLIVSFIRKKPKKKPSIVIVISLVLFIVCVGSSSTSNTNNTNTLQTTQKEKPYAEELSIIENNTSGTFKGKHYSTSIKDDNGDGKYEVSISLDANDNRFNEAIWCGINGLGEIDGIKKYHPEFDEKISVYNLAFFAEDSQKYSVIIDNSSKMDITEINLTSAETGETTVITRHDIAIYQENKAKAEAEAKAKAEAAKYETGITYDQLARTPDKYKESYVNFTGDVVQVMEDGGVTQLRIAVNGNYDNILLASYPSSVTSERVLENDNITIKGKSRGLITYTSTLGGKITIPSVYLDILTINK